MPVLAERDRLLLNPEGTEARYGKDWTVVRGTVVSFGYGHRPLSGDRLDRCVPAECRHVPRADATLDATVQYYNPHHDPRMRHLTGLDDLVLEQVLNTPGAVGTIDRTVSLAVDLLNDVANRKCRQVRLAVGCVGGRHRSVAMAEEIAHRLWTRHEITFDVAHLDVGKELLPPRDHGLRS
ncbi:RNase adapter RapZ [Kitasatospora sp. NPDC002551]|uniref:RapZ C-terminal domain-containing protein n=1 Tax=Kitasatospora sp. NPDC002551 TaxID=3154539 RepID=UPI00332BB90B